MEKSAVLLKIDALEENLSEKEKNVVDYIKENYLHIIRYSIVEFAENVDASEATIVRLCKKLGYKGFQDFKISLAQEAKNPIEYIFEKAEESDSIYDIFCKEIGSIVSTMNYTARVIDKKTLEIVANSIMKARKIVLYGSGNSASVAMDGAHKFLRAGCIIVKRNFRRVHLKRKGYAASFKFVQYWLPKNCNFIKAFFHHLLRCCRKRVKILPDG